MKSVFYLMSTMIIIGIFLLSTIFSLPVEVDGISFIDKLQHSFAYFALILSLLFSFHQANNLNIKSWSTLMFFCVFYGFLIEIIQLSVFPNRYFDWFDIIANSIGIGLGSMFFYFIKKYDFKILSYH